jgi:peptidoglycan hydrolase-like protein with peptidoglycan-binding domain
MPRDLFSMDHRSILQLRLSLCMPLAEEKTPMETLAYLHLAQEYECPEYHEWKRSNRPLIALLGILSTLSSLSLAQTAQALGFLQYDDCGAEVTRLQDLLRNAGYFPRSSTGFFGEVTEAAVQDFQRAKGLTVDGIAGDHTFKALEASTRPAPSPPTSPNTRPTPVTPAPVTPAPVTPAPGGSGDTLGFGDSGASVARLQDLLRRAGYLSGPSTGFFGTATREALIRFQEANRLRADGFAGQAVIVALENAPAASGTVASGTGSTPGSSGTNSGTLLVANPPVATTPSLSLTRTLMVGDEGDDVRSLQRQLTALRYYSGPITGEFGTLTESAVRSFQRDKNLAIDGMVGAQTVALLR